MEGYRGKQLQALGIGRPQVEVQTVVGPSPRARGNQVSSPDDQYSPDITGAFVRGTVSIIQPIFTWGLVENARMAAEHGVRAAQAGVDVKSTEVALRVKQAYWGAVAAKAIRGFLLEVRDQVDQAIARTERLVEGGYATDIDLYRFRSKRGELERFINLAEKTLDLATQALGTWTGQPTGVAVEPADAALPADMKPLPSVDLYVQNALAGGPSSPSSGRASRRAGGWSRSSASRATRSSSSASWAIWPTRRTGTGSRTPTSSTPCTTRPSGRSSASSTTSTSGSAPERSRKPRRRSRSSKRSATIRPDGIPLQVRDAYTTVVEAERNARVLAKRHDNAKQWLVASSSNVDLGVGDPDDLADAFVQYARSRAEYLQALYAYVFGLEQLAHAAGQDVAEVQRLAPTKP